MKNLKSLTSQELIELCKIIYSPAFKHTSGKWKIIPYEEIELENGVIVRNKWNDYSFDFDFEDNSIRLIKGAGDSENEEPISSGSWRKILQFLDKKGVNI